MKIKLLAKNKIEDIDQLNNYQQQKQDERNDLLKHSKGVIINDNEQEQ